MAEARQAVRVIRNGIADGMGAMQVATPAQGRVEMQENARHSQSHDADVIQSRRAMQRQFEANLRPLTPRQETAINLLTMGKTVVATARTIKVDPCTVHRWKAHNPLFAAELNRRQAALFDTMVVKLRITMGKAVDELMSLMNSNIPSKRVETMWKLLPMIKPQRLMIPTAPLEPADIVDEEIRAERIERGEAAEMDITNEERLERVDEEDLAKEEPRRGDACIARNDEDLDQNGRTRESAGDAGVAPAKLSASPTTGKNACATGSNVDRTQDVTDEDRPLPREPLHPSLGAGNRTDSST